jgi:hypothetical protein
MSSLLEIAIFILIMDRTAEIICKEDKKLNVTARSAIGAKKSPIAIGLNCGPHSIAALPSAQPKLKSNEYWPAMIIRA